MKNIYFFNNLKIIASVVFISFMFISGFSQTTLLLNSSTNGTTQTGSNYSFYDSGGSAGNYSNNESYTLTFQAPAGQFIKFAINSLVTEAQYDYLKLYNGSSTSSPQIGFHQGTVSPVTIYSTGNSMTVKFTSDNATVMAGFFASVTQVTSIPTSLLTNWGLEADTYDTPPTGWSWSSVGTGGYAWAQPQNGAWSNTQGANNGTLSLGSNGSVNMWQEINATPGNTYNLTFYIGADGNANTTHGVKLEYYTSSGTLISSSDYSCVKPGDYIEWPPTSGFRGPYSLNLAAAPSNAAKVRVTAYMTIASYNSSLFYATKVDNFMLTTTTPAPSCSLTSAGKTNEACNNNGTASNPADDYITFSLNPTGTGLGTGYTVTASGGATVTPTTGTYGSATNFQLQNGSANGTPFTITVTDNASGTCTVTTIVQQNSCSIPPPCCTECTAPDGSHWVKVENLNNPADGPAYSTVVNGNTIVHNDPNQVGRGVVPYTYYIRDGFVTYKEYLAFLNAVDPTNSKGFREGLYSDNGNTTDDIFTNNGVSWSFAANFINCYQNLTAAQLENMTIHKISYNSAARFCNWKSTGNIEIGAYTFEPGGDAWKSITNINYSYPGVRLPNEDEYYKASYWNSATNYWNLFGTNSLDANGIPIVSSLNPDGTYTNLNGIMYKSTLCSGQDVYMEKYPRQGAKSPCGLFMSLGGYHDWINPRIPTYPIQNMAIRTGNEYAWEDDMKSSFYNNTSYSAGGYYPSPSFRLVTTVDPCNVTCSLTSAGETNEACNNNGTASNPADDYITFSLNPTGTGLGSGYTVTASGGATVTPTTGTYGSATSFRLQNGSANGTTYTITVTDNATGACTITTTVQQSSCNGFCPTNLLVNGSFEQGAPNSQTPPPGWTGGQADFNPGSFSTIDGIGFGYTIDPAQVMYQEVTSTSGEIFSMTFYSGLHVNYGQTVTMQFYNGTTPLGGPVVHNITKELDSPPQTFGGPYTLTTGAAPAGTTKVRVSVNGATGHGFDGAAKVDAMCLSKTTSFNPPVPTCTPGTNVMHWTQSVNPVNGDASVVKLYCESVLTYTIPSSNYPALLTSGVPVTVNISEVVSYDGYPGRSSVTQNNEQWRLIFKKAGSIVGTSNYTNDIPDMVEQGSWVGSLGTVTLPAGADEIIVEHWEVNNGTCASPNSVIPTSVCLSVTSNCNLTSAGKTNEACNNNGTASNPADDYITFSLNPTGTGLGSGYTVTASGGATVTPTSGTYGSATNFQLQNGSANGTTYTITVTDNVNATCTATTTVSEAACSVCGIAATTAPDCNNNNTMAIKTDDYFTVIVNGTTTTPGTSNKYIIVYNGTTLNPGGTTYGTQFTIGTNKIFSANGTSTYIILIKDFDDATCYVSKTVGPIANCSTCPVPDCLNVQMKKN